VALVGKNPKPTTCTHALRSFQIIPAKRREVSSVSLISDGGIASTVSCRVSKILTALASSSVTIDDGLSIKQAVRINLAFFVKPKHREIELLS
jgi:hypothetical protein